MMDMFRTKLAVIIDSKGSPTATVAECIERALHAEFRLANDKDKRIKRYKAQRNQNKPKKKKILSARGKEKMEAQATTKPNKGLRGIRALVGQRIRIIRTRRKAL